MPGEALTGWLDTIAGYNPVTYVLDGLRSLITEGWMWAELAKGLVAIALVGLASMSMCFAALRGRVKRG